MKSFRLDGGGVSIDPGRDVHLEAGVARGARHRQPVRDEVPVFGDEVDDAWLRSRAVRRTACGALVRRR